ncbi:alpha-amylase, partial [Candidatus Desantisbacteria bacterium]|nr:alpha-amylase [Candidatus Desantisbacteria bacterium]
MKKINLILGIHCHQPIGNFDSVFENTYKNSYLPLLEMLLKYPEIKFSLHYSGVLLEWIEKKHPEYFEIIKSLVKRNQIELIGGAFYEPILSVIPDNDKIDQLRFLSSYIKNNFSFEVKGLWLAERVWETHLP